jgi:phage antirepressor YoqD-like protein
MLEKDGEDNLVDRLRNEEVLYREQGEKNIMRNEKKEGQLNWSHLALKLPCKTHY